MSVFGVLLSVTGLCAGNEMDHWVIEHSDESLKITWEHCCFALVRKVSKCENLAILYRKRCHDVYVFIRFVDYFLAILTYVNYSFFFNFSFV